MPLPYQQIDRLGLPEVLKTAGGTIYGVVLNDERSVKKLEAQLDQPPYKQPPNAPILYIKPNNTIGAAGDTVTLPAGEASVEIGATIGLVMGETATRVSEAEALTKVAGMALFVDLSLPHDSYYRPAIREKCFDGACPVSHQLVPISGDTFDADISLAIAINGSEEAPRVLDDLVRTPAQLIADVSEFMTLRPGDVLLVGVAFQAPQASIGDEVKVSAEGVGQVQFTVDGAGGES